MALDVDRGQVGTGATEARRGRGLRDRAAHGVLFGCACATALLIAASPPGLAQNGVVIGGGAEPGFIGIGRSDVVVNDEVLDNLGPGPAPALPYTPPGAQAPGYGVPSTAPISAYRTPRSDQLVVTRPGTLLYPPMEYPRSRLIVPITARGTPTAAGPSQARAPAAGVGRGKLESRLLVPPTEAGPPSTPTMPAAPRVEPPPLIEPVEEETIARATPAPAEQPGAQRAPRTQAAAPPAPAALAAELQTAPAAEPAVPAPPPMTQELGKGERAPEPPASVAEAPVLSAPPPPASEVLEPASGEIQTAALPPAGAPLGEMRLLFEAGSAELSDDAKAQLKGLAQRLSQDSSTRVQLLAFAKGAGNGASRARRLSLSRALAVRAFLIDQGIRSTRMDVRALGDKVEDGPADRVDILPHTAKR